MILISGLKQLQNIAAFHNEERNHSTTWEEEGEEGGEEGKGEEGGRGGGEEGKGGIKKEGQCEGEQRGGSRERMCACSARKLSLSMYMMYMCVRTWTCTCFLSSILFHFSFSSYLPPLPSLFPPSLPVELTSSFTEATCKSD